MRRGAGKLVPAEIRSKRKDYVLSVDVLKIEPKRVSVERITNKGSETKGILGFAPFSHKLSELSVMLYVYDAN